MRKVVVRKRKSFLQRMRIYLRGRHTFLASILSFSHLRCVFLDRVIHFGEALGDQVKGRSPKKLESLIEVPNVVHLIVHVLILNVILISSQQRVARPSYAFRRSFRRSGKGSFSEKAKNFNNVSLSMPSESTCFQLQYDPSLISVACSQTELSISGKIWAIR